MLPLWELHNERALGVPGNTTQRYRGRSTGLCYVWTASSSPTSIPSHGWFLKHSYLHKLPLIIIKKPSCLSNLHYCTPRACYRHISQSKHPNLLGTAGLGQPLGNMVRGSKSACITCRTRWPQSASEHILIHLTTNMQKLWVSQTSNQSAFNQITLPELPVKRDGKE